MAELRDHRLDVSEGLICRIFASLILLCCAHLDLDLLSSVTRKLLHVSLHKLNLGVQVSVAQVSILQLLFKLEVLHLKVVDRPLELLLTFLQALVLLSKLSKFSRELCELLLKLIHG